METTTTDAKTTDTKPRKAVKLEKTPLKTLCSQLRIEPKAARRKLRKAGFGWHDLRDRWMMTPKQLEQARNTLKPPKAEAEAKAEAKTKATRKAAKPAAAPAANA